MLAMTDTGSASGSVGERVRALREERGWSQTELGVRSGVEQTIISRMERGRMSNPSHRAIAALASALGVTAEALVGQEPPRTASLASEPSTLEAAVLLVPGLSRFDLRAARINAAIPRA